MKKYLKIYKRSIENGFSYISQYRGDTWFNIFMTIAWIGMIFLTIEIIFSQTQVIAGWEKHEVYLLAIIWAIVDEISVLTFRGNLTKIPEIITNGDLDFYLIRPVSTLFLISTKYVLFRAAYRMIVEFIILTWLIMHFNFVINGYYLVIAFVLLIVGLIVEYSIYLIANTFSFWFYRIDNINAAIGSVSSISKYPLNVFPKTIRIITLTILPIAFSAYVPIATLFGKWPWIGIIYVFVFAAIILTIAIKFWNFAVKQYSSASS